MKKDIKSIGYGVKVGKQFVSGEDKKLTFWGSIKSGTFLSKSEVKLFTKFDDAKRPLKRLTVRLLNFTHGRSAKMKIDELAEKLNELESLRIEKRSDGMIIYSKDNTDYDFFFSLGYKNKSLTDVGFDWSCLDDVKPADLYKALNLIDCFLHTPIDERFPEKKYRLRWITDDDGTPNYVHKLCGSWNWNTNKRDTKTFTEKELQQLKINNPRFAPAIDAMKELVEED